MKVNQLRNEYIQYTTEFDEKLKSGEIIDERGVFKEKTSGGGINPLIGRLTYSEWLLERILLSIPVK